MAAGEGQWAGSGVFLLSFIKLFVIKLINDTMLKYKIITEAFSRLLSIVVSFIA